MKEIKLVLYITFIFSFTFMNAQKRTRFDSDKPIQLSENLTIFQEEIIEDNMLYWKLYLKKEGEKELKLLDKEEVETGSSETIMLTPKLINACMIGEYMYIFIYRNYTAMIEIYHFTEDVHFEKTGYSLCSMIQGSVMNFGLYSCSVDIQKIGNSYCASFIAGRGNRVQEKDKKLLRIQNNDIFEIVIKEDSEKTIFYPYRIKEVEDDISRKEKEKIFHRELKKQLEERNLLEKNEILGTYGYINDVTNDMRYYIFYKTSISQKTMKLVKYGRYFINGHANFYLMFADYIEKPLYPEYGPWNPKK